MTKLTNTTVNKKVELFSLGILLIYMLYYLPRPEELHSFCIAPYLLRYEDLGFISRGLVGSLWGSVFPYVSMNIAWVIIAAQQLLLIAITVWYIHHVIRNLDERSGISRAVVYLVVVFLACPASVSFLFYWGNYGRLDLFMIFGTLICAILLIKDKCLWCIPLLCCIMMSIHQGFCFMYFPCVLALLMCFWFNRKSRKYLILCGITFAAGTTAFLIFQFFGKITALSLDETLAIIANRTDFPAEHLRLMVELEYYTSPVDFIMAFVVPSLKKNCFKLLVTAVVCFPLIWLLGYITKNYARISGNKQYLLTILFVVISILPKFIFTVDYGRDLAAVFLSLMIIHMTLIAAKDTNMTQVLAGMQKKICEHGFLYLAGLVELASVGKFEAANILNISDRAYNAFVMLINWIR